MTVLKHQGMDPAERAERLRGVEAELEAVVRNTEDATHHIMASAEAIMMADANEPGYSAFVKERVMEMFEACSFQDINGQRLRKAADVLMLIDATPDVERKAETRRKERMISGPSGSSDQAAVDKLFD